MESLVNVLHESPLPCASKIPIALYYGPPKGPASVVVNASQAVRFDSLITSMVSQVTMPPPPPDVSIDSIKNCLRWAYHTSRKTAFSHLIRPAKFPFPVLDTRHAEPGNIAHLLINILPYCLHTQALVHPKTVMVFRKMAPLFVNLIRRFDIEPTVESRRLEGDIVKISGTRGLAVYELIKTDEVWPSTFMPNIYDKFEFSGRSDFPKIFLARRGDRALRNHSEAVDLVARFGYKTIFMEDYPLEEQLTIGAKAQHVIAIHGAAMAFLVMAKRIESVIELMPDHTYAEYFPVSLGARVAHYEQIISSFDETFSHLGWSTLVHHKTMPFSVDLEVLGRRLELLN